MDNTQATQNLPEPGQLVMVCQRHFVILDVQRSNHDRCHVLKSVEANPAKGLVYIPDETGWLCRLYHPA